MIITNTEASASVQGTTALGQIDSAPPNGFSPFAALGKWIGSPGPGFAVSALGQATATTNLDWSQAGYFSFTAYGGGQTITFGLTASTTTASYQLGQLILVKIAHAGSSSITWPSTITWTGIATSGANSSSAPTTTSHDVIAILVCTATGSAPTFDGYYLTGA